MPVRRLTGNVDAAAIRALSPEPPTAAVAEIVSVVAERGDAALLELEREHSASKATEVEGLRVPPPAISEAPTKIDPALLDALKRAIANVTTAGEAQLTGAHSIELPEGQSVRYLDHPVGRVAAYIPGGRGAYPSTAVMCLATARAAGVEDICVFSPPRDGGNVDPAVLAVCALLEVDEVWTAGGAQAVAAAALGTDAVRPVDVVVGPGSSWVQEAKRQLVGRIGIDSVAGPSELVVVADATADAELVALDLLAQGEHGEDSLVVLLSDDEALRASVAERCDAITAELAVVATTDMHEAVELAAAIAPEHLELMVAPEHEAELLDRVRNAGAVFVGRNGATAFGDYIIGSNHVLPTGGSARFSSALSVATFRRRHAEIHVPDVALAPLIDAGATIARAEGFTKHAESMEARRLE